MLSCHSLGLNAQDAPSPSPGNAEALLTDDEAEVLETPESVTVQTQVEDSAIAVRLQRIYDATGWYENVEVRTDEGVVFVEGIADTDGHARWAADLARRTEGVVAVVNSLTVRQRSVWDIAPATERLKELGRETVLWLPRLLIGMVVLLLTSLMMKLAAITTRYSVGRRIDNALLLQVTVTIVATFVLLIGLYIALRISGLSRLAVTVLGGTGLIGLALGFAFRDIAENYLASILISLNRPFRLGDIIEVDGNKGFVRQVTTRGTMLATLDGNHVQIPNSMVYKSVITNYTVSPRLRRDFTVGIGYDDSISHAQEVILRVIAKHPATLQEPRPMVLVDALGAATVNLKVFYWIDSKQFDVLSVASAVMRLTKAALIEAKVSLPDESREVIFPAGVSVRLIRDREPTRSSPTDPHERPASVVTAPANSDDSVVTDGEGQLSNKDHEYQEIEVADQFDPNENLLQ